MLTVADLQQHLTRVSFMPGWDIEVREGRWEGPHIVIAAKVPNAYRPDEPMTLDVHTSLPPMHTYGQFDEWLVWRLNRLWSHEVREFYRVDGVPPFDPHGPHSDRDL